MVELVEHIYDALERHTDKSKLAPEEIARLRRDYSEFVETRGAEILSVNRITRTELESPHPLKNADFSLATVSELIDKEKRTPIWRCEDLFYLLR